MAPEPLLLWLWGAHRRRKARADMARRFDDPTPAFDPSIASWGSPGLGFIAGVLPRIEEWSLDTFIMHTFSIVHPMSQ